MEMAVPVDLCHLVVRWVPVVHPLSHHVLNFMAKFHRQLSCALLFFSLPTVQLQSDGWACTSFAGELREWVSSEAIRGSGHGQGRGGRWAGGFCWGTDGHSRLPQPVCELCCAFPFVWINTDGRFYMPGMHGTTA